MTAGSPPIDVAVAAGIAVLSLMMRGGSEDSPTLGNDRAGGDDGGSACRDSPRRTQDGPPTGQLPCWTPFVLALATYVPSGPRAGLAAGAPRRLPDRLGCDGAAP